MTGIWCDQQVTFYGSVIVWVECSGIWTGMTVRLVFFVM